MYNSIINNLKEFDEKHHVEPSQDDLLKEFNELKSSRWTTEEDIADEITHYAYTKFPDVAFTGEGKTPENEIVLYFNPDKEDYYPFKQDLAEHFNNAIRISVASPEYAPELRKVAVIVNKID